LTYINYAIKKELLTEIEPNNCRCGIYWPFITGYKQEH